MRKMEQISEEIRVALAIIVSNDGKILLERKGNENDIHYEAPGGKFLTGEIPLNAVKREIQEETGLEIFPHNECYKVGFSFRNNRQRYIFHFFRARISKNSNEIKIVPEDPEMNFIWVTPIDALQNLKMKSALKEALTYFINRNEL